ncbi:MAG: hypothetical protein AAGD22_14125 [Verrucomicrobiota bacterium]
MQISRKTQRQLLFGLATLLAVASQSCSFPTPLGQASRSTKSTPFVVGPWYQHHAHELYWTYESDPDYYAEARLTVGDISSEAVTQAEGIALSKVAQDRRLDWAKVILGSRTTTEGWHISALREGPSLESIGQPFEIITIVHMRTFITGYAKEDRRVSVRLYTDGRVVTIK